MPITDIYSKRQKKLRGEMPDVYVYDDLPYPLRVQIVHIWDDTCGSGVNFRDDDKKSVSKILCKEYGTLELLRGLNRFLLEEKDYEKVLDVVELSFQKIECNQENIRSLHQGRPDVYSSPSDAIEELNNRFKEHGVGYQLTNGQIIRIDSEFIHAEVVKPALNLLDQKHYAGSQQEFLKAHEHYRKGNSKEALSECLKAFESVMKAICAKRGWTYGNNATAKPLIQACFDNGLIPSFWQSHYSSLRNLLECSVPTGRNKLSGHGQGTTPVSVPDHLVAYMLHMTASAIVFLAEADEKAP